MDWIEIAVETRQDAADTVAAILERYGHQGVVIEHGGGVLLDSWEDELELPDTAVVKVYLPADENAHDTQNQIKDALRTLTGSTPAFRHLQEQDWAEAWKAHYKPLRIGQHIYIRPNWIDVDDAGPEDIVIALDPGMAFGTGTHETTQLCLEVLESVSLERPGLSVLDLGCGSGILSIAAVKLGAAKVLALDIDKLAVKATQENALANDVAEQIYAQQGSLESLLHAARRFDVALVNILARVIVTMCEDGLGKVIRPGGTGIFSGMILDQVDEVEAALRSADLEPVRRRTSGEWAAIEAVRPVP